MACYGRAVTDPTRSIRAGAAGIIPPGPSSGFVETATDHRGFHRLVRGLRTGEARRTADRLREGDDPRAQARRGGG